MIGSRICVDVYEVTPGVWKTLVRRYILWGLLCVESLSQISTSRGEAYVIAGALHRRQSAACMSYWRAFCRWIFWRIPLGPLAPHVFHMSLPAGCRMKLKMKRVKETDATV